MTQVRLARFAILLGTGVAVMSACAAPVAERHASSEQQLETCAHPICAPGGSLLATCDPCASRVCALDPYCCQTAWDATCVGEVGSICGSSCSAPTLDAGTSTCSHPVCAVGAALVASCDPCAAELCAADPYCCSGAWDATCVGEVGSICQKACN